MKQRALTLCLTLGLITGCATQNFEVERTKLSPDTEFKTSDITFIESEDLMSCPDDRVINTIRIDNNWAKSALNVITLGLVYPYSVTYTCGKIEPCVKIFGTDECAPTPGTATLAPSSSSDEG